MMAGICTTGALSCLARLNEMAKRLEEDKAHKKKLDSEGDNSKSEGGA